MNLNELQKSIELGTDHTQQVHIESLGMEVPIRELTKRELIALSAMATENVNISFNADGTPKANYKVENVLTDQAKVDAQAMIYALKVEGMEEMTVDHIIDNWRPKAVEEIAQAIYDLTGEDPKDALNNSKRKATGDSFRGKGKSNK